MGIDMAKPQKRRQRRATGKRQGNLKEAIVLVPLTYNDGTKVPGDVLESIREELFVAFHGWTIEGAVKGAYRMQTGRKRVEDLQKLSIILNESQLSELEVMVARWGASLGQETMLMKISDFVVKFIRPHTEEEEP
jgi:hypothetical protein